MPSELPESAAGSEPTRKADNDMTSLLHVATTGSDDADGSAQRPLRTINRAAALARPGDTVVVHAGEYREWVAPPRGGLSDTRRITYTAAEGEHVVIKGSERITGWTREDGTVWRVAVPNTMFGDFNPYAEEVSGDWIVYPGNAAHKHLGDVYLNGLSFYEVASAAEVAGPQLRTEVVDNWTGVTDRVRNPEQTRLVWYAEVGDGETTIWANFQGADPNTELVEINVRRSVFYPLVPHLDYITVRGFELAQAACPWTPPTADQPGLIGPNWAKGWIIEDNVIHDAKCSAISIGKEASTGHNYSTERGDKPGYQYQLESVFSAQQIGWDSEHIGSHIIRRNTIYDCGQNGIVGHLGCVFSTIEDNHIYNIAIKREFYGYEIGGIKLHAAIDVEIRHNRIHDCSLGTWLDWQTQGTRVSRNVFYNNSRDLFIEVSHGPYLVEHNVLGSPAAFESFSQGGAFVNNLILGTMRVEPVMDRATPYHRPHSTQVAGYAVIFGADDRYVGNVFLGGDPAAAYAEEAEGVAPAFAGTAGYNGHPASFEEYLERIAAQPPGDHQRFLHVKQPVYARSNVYAAGAKPFSGEDGPHTLDTATASIVEDGDEVYLVSELPEAFDQAKLGALTGRDLPRVRFPDADFEERDGSPAVIDVDLTGAVKEPGTTYAAGPVAGLKSGSSRVRIW
ncbi:right-handed parallel beta-helix repeat-containing protein [Actinoplanes sp. GCM10030250]|uniref:right-handed parallel beta-helix repeat-containing protein n=1 Tax=Actinoplanes sp. GCM10030250 TaxID=3273376 RepID=UPI00362005F0